MKKIVCGLLSVLLCFVSFLVVHAEDATYMSYGGGNSVVQLTTGSETWYFQSDLPARLVCLSVQNYTTYNYIYAIFENEPVAGVSTSLPVTVENQGSSQSYNGNRYYYIKLGYSYSNATVNIPIVYVSYGNQSSVTQAIKYTFGDGAVDPEPPVPVFGDLANVGYNTKIAGSGQSAINNLDTVSWNPETDTSGNDISDMSVSVRAVPGKYAASSRQSLAEKLYSDFVLNTLEATVLDTVPVSSGSFSITWEDVIDTLALPFATVASIVDQDGTFIKNGWIYQVRLEGDNYTGDWQTVYTATSSGVENDLTIIQSTTINQSLVNTITEINQLNSTSNNWYINETTINMSDYTEPSQGDKPWWAYLLEAIVSLINKLIDGISSIVGAIADLVGDIIDGILGLFTFDSFSVPDFSTHQQNIHDNSGIFGESIDILQTMNQTISNADSSAEPILYYPGIDLEGVEFIPEITINLNDYVEDLGLTQWHNLAYTCTDIFIWTTLIYTIYRKLIGVFKK